MTKPALCLSCTQAGQLDVAEALFESTLAPDGITFEAFIAACGIAGTPEKVGWDAVFAICTRIVWRA